LAIEENPNEDEEEPMKEENLAEEETTHIKEDSLRKEPVRTED